MPEILAVDPGPVQSAFVVYDSDAQAILRKAILPNDEMLLAIRTQVACGANPLAIEMVESYGMPVGREVFETVRWAGRFEERYRNYLLHPGVHLIPRRDVKLHLCNSSRAKDSNIRQALLDKLGAIGTKMAPGPLYGMKKDLWAALAVAVTFAEASAEKREGWRR